MSSVTDIILTCSVLEDEGGTTDAPYPAIESVNKYLRDANKGVLVHLNGHEGGHRAWQVEVFGGAFNYLDHEDFVRALKSAPWQEPEAVTLLVQGEHDDTMREFRISDAPCPNATVAEFLSVT